MSEGIILWGVRSIFYVMDIVTLKEYKCVIKGKILETDFKIKNRKENNPLVAGDRVEFTITDNDNGWIISRKQRINEFKRLKNSGREIQTIVANIDYLIIVDSIDNPPLRTFFIDRCIFSADYMNIPVIIVFNKIDLLKPEINEYYKNAKKTYKKLGYETIETSILTNTGIEMLKEKIKGNLVSFNGRSGVGKSSLIKAIDPKYHDIKIGEINKKYDRGVHTTTYAKVYALSSGGNIVDTPGIRELAVYIDKSDDVENYFKDFDKFRSGCKFPNCQHIDEPDCKVIEALENGKIEEFRYESYMRIRETVVKFKDSRI
jgi:ribosome biogenesis GTPase / thiamine phosphate phosphatase